MLRISKSLFVLWGVSFSVFLGGVSFGRAQDDGSTAIALVNGTLIDGTGADPVPDAVIVIQEGRIVAVGSAAGVEIPAEAQIIDVGGATMLPGFFNTHVHDSYSQDYLTSWVQAGVTTVRDMGIHESLDWPDDQLPSLPDETDPLRAALIKGFAIRDLTRQDPHYARLVAAGPFLNVPGGYGGTVYPAETPEEVQAAVNDLLDLGADLIKTALDDGRVIRQQLPIYSPGAFSALVAAAHERGAPVAVHIMRSDQLLMAIGAGVDEIEHMAVDTLPDEVIQQAVAHDVFWVPTLELWNGVSEAHGVGFRQATLDNLGRFLAAGGKVALGTDFHGYFTPFEEGMPITEINLMHEAGMTPMQIVVAATLHAAQVCQLDADLGTLEVGKIADVLIVDGDPLTDLQTLLNVRWVLRDGVIVREPES